VTTSPVAMPPSELHPWLGGLPASGLIAGVHSHAPLSPSTAPYLDELSHFMMAEA